MRPVIDAAVKALLMMPCAFQSSVISSNMIVGGWVSSEAKMTFSASVASLG
jgi:hypothetical protein